MKSSPTDRGERDLLALVTAELERLVERRPLPAISLTDKPVSTAYPARGWRAARIEIRREAAVSRCADALRGEIAHEYAHVLDPAGARQFALTLLAFEIGALGLAGWLVGAIAPWYDRAHSLLWLGFWLAGILLIGAGMCLGGWLSHRRELRADALAAKLLGDAGPVLAMLEDSCAKHERLGRAARLSALLTHPSPTRRRTALLARPAGQA